ncbi:MAG: hypothetical protein K9N06_02550 [Candidatus Cloacimonetes bacterium]|nr:hypothetical protein [Candidatus Cloacimonadota bacterium]
MKIVKLSFLLLIVVLILCTCDNSSSGPGNTNPKEKWDIEIDDGAGNGSFTLELLPDSTITIYGSWEYNYYERNMVTCNFSDGIAVIDGSDFYCYTEGSAHDHTYNENSDFHLELGGILFNGAGYGVSVMQYFAPGWEDYIEGTWTATLVNGEGITMTEGE